MQPAFKVIYIVGEARSGSTMLDILLSNGEEVMGVGELWSFFENDEACTGICSCGMPLPDCDFWQRVRAEYLVKTTYDLSHIRNLRLHQERVRWLPLRMVGIQGREYRRYSRYMRGLFETLAAVGGKSIMIDSSKQIGRAFSLLMCPDLDVYLVHLVRDGRGILWSRLRDKQSNPAIYQTKTGWQKSSLFTILSWGVKNLVAICIGKFAGDKYILVRYEEIVTAPLQQLARIGARCGLEMQSLVDKLELGEGINPGHQIGGNLKTRSKPQLYLKLDTEWEAYLPLYPRLLFLVLAGWLAKWLGYKDVWTRSTKGAGPAL